MTQRKEAAVSFLRMVVAGNIHEAYQKYVNPEMRHHNIYFPGDAASLEKAMTEAHIKFPTKDFEIKHTLEDRDMVVTHSRVRLNEEMPDMGVVHIFRFQNDKIMEMWDLGQAVPKDSPNKNGMF